MKEELKDIHRRILAIRGDNIPYTYLFQCLSEIKYLIEECLEEIEDEK